MKRFCLSICIAFALSLQVKGESSKELVLISNGKSDYTICIPAKPNKTQKFGAQELQKFIQKVSGAKLPIKKAGDKTSTGKTIYLGAPWINEGAKKYEGKSQIDPKSPKEGFEIKEIDGNVVIAGGNDLGTLYGIYEFLEKHLGIRWFMPGEIGEVIPKNSEVKLENIDTMQAPDFKIRWILSGDWALRNKMNARLPQIAGPDALKIKWGGHSFRYLMPLDKYYDKHPEYFALFKGKRRRCPRVTHENQICTSNPDAVKEVIKNMRKELDKDPQIDLISLSPNDGYGFCECAKCCALDEEPDAVIKANSGGKAEDSQKAYLTRRLLIFYAQVAEAVKESHPNAMINSFAYSCFTQPPKDKSIKCPDNLIIQICHSTGHHNPINDPNDPTSRDYKKLITSWGEMVDNIMFYEYYHKVSWLELPFPIIHSIREDIPWMKKNKAIGLYTQSTSKNCANLHLNYYIAAKLLWNSRADVDALLNDFYQKFYQESSEPMKKYYELLENTMVERKIKAPEMKYDAMLKMFTPDVLEKAGEYLQEAAKLAQEPKVKARVQMVRNTYNYAVLVMNYLRSIKDFTEGERWAADSFLDKEKAERWNREISKHLAKLKKFIKDNEKNENFCKAASNGYVKAFLRPKRTLVQLDKNDKTPGQIVLDKTKYLKTKGVDLAPKKINENDSFDLWVYGYDFDADEEKSEHEVFIETKEGKDKLIGGLAPKGIKRGTDANQCYIFKNLKWSEFPQKQLKVKIRNVPGDWVFSTVYAIYIMPHSQIDNEKAGDMIRNRRDRVQEDALGFVEFSHQGLLNRDDMTDTFIIDIPGSTKN